MERKLKEQIDVLSSRVSELDIENRRLRESKYDLDSKVKRWNHAWAASAALPGPPPLTYKQRGRTITPCQARASSSS